MNDDFLNSFAQYPNEVEYYRTSTDKDEFIAPQLPDNDNQVNEIESESAESNKFNDEILRIIEEMFIRENKIKISGKPTTVNIPTEIKLSSTTNKMIHAEISTNKETSNESVSTEQASTTSTENYIPKTLKRPAQLKSVDDVLKAFRLLNNWKFNK